MENLSDFSNDSAPEERTFTQARKNKPKIGLPKLKKQKKTPKIVNSFAPQLKKDIEETMPMTVLKKIDDKLNFLEEKNEKETQKIIETDSLVKRTKVINKKIKLVFQNTKRPLSRVNKEALEQKRKYFMDDKKRVPLNEILQK